MPRFPQLFAVPSLSDLLSVYGPALLALLVTALAAVGCRAKARQAWLRPGLALGVLVGWAALEPLSRLRAAALMPPLGPAMLILPAGAVLAVELVRRWRAGRNDRLLSVGAAGVVGWWLARTSAGPAEFWRIAIVTAACVGLVAWLVRQQPRRALAVALAAWGGLLVIGGQPGWIAAAAVLVACCAGPAILRAPAAVPSALLVALLAGVSLARGRLARGHLDAVDTVCLLALAAPVLAGLAEARLGQRWRPLAPALGAAVAVALGSALSWGLRRTAGV